MRPADDSNLIRLRILEKMARHRFWGRRHTSIDNIPKGFKPHIKNQILHELKRLIQEGLVLAKPTSYGLEVSLNPREKARIELEMDELEKKVSNFETFK